MPQVVPETLVDDSIIRVTETGPRLLGSRCANCSVVTFPAQSGCPKCFGDAMATEELPDRGTLWTFTTQGFPPKAEPEGQYRGQLDPFEPFTVGYVELAGACKVEGRLTEPDPAKLQIGQQMRLVLVPLNDELATFAFEPVGDPS